MDRRCQNHTRNSNLPASSISINLSDLRDENTIYLEKTPTKPLCNSKENQFFHPSEMSARSTMLQKNMGSFKNVDTGSCTKGIEDILATSYSEDARNFYRNSLSSLPRTADMSRASSVSHNSSHSAIQQKKTDFWDISFATPMQFNKTARKSYSNSDSFVPAEQMQEKMRQDEIEWENEEADIPNIPEKNISTATSESMWESAQPKMCNYSMGQFFSQNDDIREIFPNKSPKKMSRVPFIDVTNSEDSNFAQSTGDYRRFNLDNMAKAIKKMESPSLFVKKIIPKSPDQRAERDVPQNDDTVANSELDESSFGFKVPATINRGLEKEYDRNYALGKRSGTDPLKRTENSVKLHTTGSKRSGIAEETPKTTVESLKRARSPVHQPQIAPVPAPRKTTPPTREDQTFRTPIAHSKSSNSDSSSSRTYHTAFGATSSPKLSLPNYGIQSSLLTSPTNSVKSCSQNSHQFAAPIKRTVSELSSGSSRSDLDDEESIPLRLSTKTLSWETVKLRKVSEKSFTVKNTSIRKQSIKICIEGSGFQLYSTELRGGFTLSPSEVRSICLEFCPTRIGAARGELILETSHGVVRKVALFAYGGHVSINIGGIQKGLYGPKFLTMGTMNQLAEYRRLDQILIIKNTGNLPAFGTLAVDKSMRRDFLITPDEVSVKPNQIRIDPGCDVEVAVEFRPKREQLRRLLNQKNSEVSSVGEIVVMFGDEATRIRLLKYSSEIEEQILKLLPLELPNENVIKRELVDFDEGLKHAKLASLRDQMKSFSFDITINHSLDETHLICPDWTINEEFQSSFQSFMEPAEATRTLTLPYIEVEPKLIYFSQYYDDLKIPKMLRIRSLTSRNEIYIELSSNCPDIVTLHPTSAAISPGDVLDVRVYGNFYPKVGKNCSIYVTLENSRVTIPLNFIVERH